ncbi:hypothetical protein T08_3971 [Trichinella sp. T8]|nr:hypothetical protein T08_3971 [Trichinella sp. T8]
MNNFNWKGNFTLESSFLLPPTIAAELSKLRLPIKLHRKAIVKFIYDKELLQDGQGEENMTHD